LKDTRDCVLKGVTLSQNTREPDVLILKSKPAKAGTID